MQQNNSGKNSTAGIVIAFLCIVVYLASLVVSAVRIFSSIDQHRDLALEEFDYIRGLAVSKGAQGFMDEAFVKTINNALANSRALEAIIVSGPTGEYAFEKERGKAILWVNDSPRFRERVDFSRQPLYQRLNIQNLRNANIEAKASVLDYDSLAGILKQGLVMVLVPLVIAGFALLLEFLLMGSKYRAPPEYKPAPAQGGAEPSGGSRPDDAGIGWEEYTAGQLDTELRRCAAEGQDLVVLAAQARNAREDFYRRFAAEAAGFFAIRELVFEKGERGVTVIYPNISLEAAFAKAEEFRRQLAGKYPQSMAAANSLCIGLSSRAGRAVDAGRLLFEADEALERAAHDPASPTVAFKSDPEKYREFIQGRA